MNQEDQSSIDTESYESCYEEDLI